MELLIAATRAGQHLSREQAEAVISRIIADEFDAGSIAEFLLALREKPETADELLGFVDGLSKQAHRLAYQPPHVLLDVCGTGGDKSGTFNVSTGVALLLASMGIAIAKHGNRGVSSQSGSSDVLEVLGLGSDTTPAQAIHSLQQYGLTFLFAPAFHPVLAKLAPIRKSLGVYTIFNALGPLLNPAPLTHQMMGVYHASLLPKAAHVLREKHLQAAFVVHGSDGLDEITLSGSTSIAHLNNGQISTFTVTPADFGLKPSPLEAVKGGTPQENAAILASIFKGEHSPKRDLIVLNAATALVLVGKVSTFKEGVHLAGQAIDTGAPEQLLNAIKSNRDQVQP